MKTLKTLILGSAAGLVAMSGAQAADLPVKAKAVEYVRICSLYGAGFFYIPGTDTCIKLGGYLRAETAFNSTHYSGAYTGALGAHNRLSNYYSSALASKSDRRYAHCDRIWRGPHVLRCELHLDDGSLRRHRHGWYTSYSAGVGQVGNPSDGGIAGGGVGINYAFIQFAGFTMGRSVSAFDAPWVNYPANNFDGLVGGSGSTNGINQFTYTAQFGNGVSGSLSAQDQARRAVGRHEPVGRYGRRYTGRVEWSQQPRWHALSGSDRRTQGRPGLGRVPAVGCCS